MSTREHLVAAAKGLLWERGYAAMSPRAVLRASGAGQGSLYHHFAGKADLAGCVRTQNQWWWGANGSGILLLL